MNRLHVWQQLMKRAEPFERLCPFNIFIPADSIIR